MNDKNRKTMSEVWWVDHFPIVREVVENLKCDKFSFLRKPISLYRAPITPQSSLVLHLDMTVSN